MLPIELTRYFADSRLEVKSFTCSEEALVILIVKDIGPEAGIIVFRQVTFMSLPTSMMGEAIRVRPVREAGPDFWARCQLADDWFDSDDMVFEIESQDGPVYFVVAKTVGYEVVAESSATVDTGGRTGFCEFGGYPAPGAAERGRSV